jgi:hypothetical protein
MLYRIKRAFCDSDLVIKRSFLSACRGMIPAAAFFLGGAYFAEAD